MIGTVLRLSALFMVKNFSSVWLALAYIGGHSIIIPLTIWVISGIILLAYLYKLATGCSIVCNWY